MLTISIMTKSLIILCIRKKFACVTKLSLWYKKCHRIECHYAKCHFAKRPNAVMLNLIMPSVIMLNAKCHYAIMPLCHYVIMPLCQGPNAAMPILIMPNAIYGKCYHTECYYSKCDNGKCHHAKCHYGECCGAQPMHKKVKMVGLKEGQSRPYYNLQPSLIFAGKAASLRLEWRLVKGFTWVGYWLSRKY